MYITMDDIALLIVWVSACYLLPIIADDWQKSRDDAQRIKNVLSKEWLDKLMAGSRDQRPPAADSPRGEL